MKNINQLEKQRKEVLLNMNHEEIIAYFDNIVNTQFEYMPKITKEGITNFNIEEYLRLEEIIEDSTKTLNSKYNHIEVLAYISKFTKLSELYDENIDSGNVLFLERILFIIFHFVKSIEKDLNLLQEHLTLFYLRYFFKVHDVIDLLKIANVPEGTIETVHDSLKEENPEFFETAVEDTFNIFIESIVKDLEENIQSFKNVKQMEEDPVEKLSSKGYPEEVIEVYRLIYRTCGYGNILLELYEDLKLNPFEQGNKIVIEEYVSLVFEEDIDELGSFEESLTDERDIRIFNCLKEGFSSNVPKYDFKEFKLIVPEGVESDEEC